MNDRIVLICQIIVCVTLLVACILWYALPIGNLWMPNP